MFVVNFSRPELLTAGGRANNPSVELVFESGMAGMGGSFAVHDVGISSGLSLSHRREIDVLRSNYARLTVVAE